MELAQPVQFPPEKSEMTVGEKRQFTVQLDSDTPLGLAVIMFKFDPRIIKINAVSAGKLFADSKSAPTLTQSTNQKGTLLISLAAAAPSQIGGQGELLTIEVEGIAAGDSGITFDLSNVHLVTADGRPSVLQLTPISLAVKSASPSAVKQD